MALVWLPNMAFNHKLSPGSPKGIYKQNINKRQKKRQRSCLFPVGSLPQCTVSIGCVGWLCSPQLSPASDSATLTLWGRAILGTPGQGGRGRYMCDESVLALEPEQQWEPHQVYSAVEVSNHGIQERKQSTLLVLWTNLWSSASSLGSSLGSFI